MSKQPRVGIYAGTFDPVHAGHISFALEALQVAALDEVCFLPERQPRTKPSVTHFAHRVAMLKRAVQPYKQLSVAEMVEKNFSVRRSLPHLKAIFGPTRLVLLMGSDVCDSLVHWPHSKELAAQCDLVISLRGDDTNEAAAAAAKAAGFMDAQITIIDSLHPHVSSKAVRHALSYSTVTKGLLASVSKYANKEWLYSIIKR